MGLKCRCQLCPHELVSDNIAPTYFDQDAMAVSVRRVLPNNVDYLCGWPEHRQEDGSRAEVQWYMRQFELLPSLAEHLHSPQEVVLLNTARSVEDIDIETILDICHVCLQIQILGFVSTTFRKSTAMHIITSNASNL